MDITAAEFGLLKDQIELMEVTTPTSGQALTNLQMRRCYGRLVVDIRVDSAALSALVSQAKAEAMASTTFLQIPEGLKHRFAPHINGFLAESANRSYEHRLYGPNHCGKRGALWWGFEESKDNLGRRWSRSIRAVVDNFGTLVEVPA